MAHRGKGCLGLVCVILGTVHTVLISLCARMQKSSSRTPPPRGCSGRCVSSCPAWECFWLGSVGKTGDGHGPSGPQPGLWNRYFRTPANCSMSPSAGASQAGMVQPMSGGDRGGVWSSRSLEAVESSKLIHYCFAGRADR